MHLHFKNITFIDFNLICFHFIEGYWIIITFNIAGDEVKIKNC